jgi:ubiquinone/menaquinone biosynthesis C-methylase UbiE
MFIKEPKRIIHSIYDFIEEEDDYVSNYELIASGDRRGIVTLETQAISNCCELLIQNHYNSDANVLDIGCGFGYVLSNLYLKEKVGLDVSINMLEQLKDDCIKVRSFAEDVPFVSNYFDIVICTDIFEHVLKPYLLVKEIERILKPNGMLLFSCPWKQDISIYETEEYNQRFPKYKYVHLRSVNEDVIDSYFQNFKFISSTEITVAMKDMVLKPYSNMFIQFIKKGEPKHEDLLQVQRKIVFQYQRYLR